MFGLDFVLKNHVLKVKVCLQNSLSASGLWCGGFFGFSAYQYQVNAARTQTRSGENWPHLDMSTDKDSGCIKS